MRATGDHQSGTVNFSFQRYLRKNLNCGDYTNDKHIIFPHPSLSALIMTVGILQT